MLFEIISQCLSKQLNLKKVSYLFALLFCPLYYCSKVSRKRKKEMKKERGEAFLISWAHRGDPAWQQCKYVRQGNVCTPSMSLKTNQTLVFKNKTKYTCTKKRKALKRLSRIFFFKLRFAYILTYIGILKYIWLLGTVKSSFSRVTTLCLFSWQSHGDTEAAPSKAHPCSAFC